MFACLLKIFPQVPGDFIRLVQERQYIDEAKELQLDRLIAHGPFHEPFVPPTRRENYRPLRIEPGEEFPAISLREVFDFAKMTAGSQIHEIHRHFWGR